MKQEKMKNIVIVLLIVIVIILLALVILFATDTIVLNSTLTKSDNEQVTENDVYNEKEKEKENEVVNNVETPTKEAIVDANKKNENNGNNNNVVKTPSVQNELGKSDTFSINTRSGVVEVIGYPEIINRKGAWDDDTYYNYVFFHIKETKSTDFRSYIAELEGNSFALNDAIGIGCSINGKISYFNSSDSLGDREYELSQENSNKILNATKDSPIKLKLERLLYTSGKGAPSCYSHITKIEVMD